MDQEAFKFRHQSHASHRSTTAFAVEVGGGEPTNAENGQPVAHPENGAGGSIGMRYCAFQKGGQMGLIAKGDIFPALFACAFGLP